MQRLTLREDCGPLEYLLTAKAMQAYYRREPQYAMHAADKGLKALSEDAWMKDVRMFSRGNHGLATACREIAENCVDLSGDELIAADKYMPIHARVPFKRLVARRKAKPEEPPGDAIEAVLLEYWHDGLKDIVESELRAMSTNVARAPEVEVETK
jgi:hypothetical protein